MAQYTQTENAPLGNINQKKNELPMNILKVGCGCLLGVVLTFISFVIIGLALPFSATKKTPVQYFQVQSGKGSATIHTGMSKDSVILLLGQPTEFRTNDYTDVITYRYGDLISKRLRIEFDNMKVVSVTQD